MIEYTCDVAVIGAGPAGLAAASSAREAGAEKVWLIERDCEPGGILQQCIHPGFGLAYFDEELTGPEYAARFYDKAVDLGVQFSFDTTVLAIEKGNILRCLSPRGESLINAKSIVLAMGCRERTRGNLIIAGSRPAGVITAGAAQRMINIQNQMIGNKVLILGSGDIGMIMARRLRLEGVEVVGVVEILPYLSGLTRNKLQCLDDFDIPLLLSHTVTRVEGYPRVEAVYVAAVDEKNDPVLASEERIECDTLLLSVGLIPENELSRNAGIELDAVTGGPVVDSDLQTSVPGIFCCGNVLHVNDLVDHVSVESELAGENAALYALGKLPSDSKLIPVQAGHMVRYVCPSVIRQRSGKSTLYFRVTKPAKHVDLQISDGTKIVWMKSHLRVNPGEMEAVCIPTADLVGPEITINVLPQ
ncbi:MAG: NAD(P)/FAD-dependent oxidoreductase [Fastidiosipilaceae bacterium]|jgi:NADPH-dependent 2,4-dienoyl-CoA reductase/sulfur reductase-like enzyme|nr:FAD-dependent oxidoreductase [Clostridiaceae bacterium]